jgi:ribose/xylose/arabinose/galactoside ABC-type transport system permease subunit
MTTDLTADNASSGLNVSRAVSWRHRVLPLLADYGALIGLIVLTVTFSVTTPFFLTTENFANIGKFAAIGGIAAAFWTVALIAEQVDLTITATVGCSAVTYGILVERHHQPVLLGVLGALAVCAVIGIANGIVVVDFGVNSFVATLAMASLVAGVTLLAAGVTTQSIFLTERSKPLRSIVTSQPIGVPLLILLMAAVYAVVGVAMARTRLGWHIYATGGNAGAAKRAGIRVGRIYRLVLLSNALAFGVCGLLLAAQANYASGTPAGLSGAAGGGTGGGLTLVVVAAVLIGGMDLGGGRGRVEQTLVGVALVAVLQNGLVLNNQSVWVQYMATGIIFVLAVILSSISRNERGR